MDRRLGRTLAIFIVIMLLGMIALRSRARRLSERLPEAAPPPPPPAAAGATPDPMRGDSVAGCDTSVTGEGRR
ncbi:MAG: hypothetical protein ACREMV_08505 [Gemmatimonadales bacterium]